MSRHKRKWMSSTDKQSNDDDQQQNSKIGRYSNQHGHGLLSMPYANPNLPFISVPTGTYVSPQNKAFARGQASLYPSPQGSGPSFQQRLGQHYTNNGSTPRVSASQAGWSNSGTPYGEVSRFAPGFPRNSITYPRSPQPGFPSPSYTKDSGSLRRSGNGSQSRGVDTHTTESRHQSQHQNQRLTAQQLRHSASKGRRSKVTDPAGPIIDLTDDSFTADHQVSSGNQFFIDRQGVEGSGSQLASPDSTSKTNSTATQKSKAANRKPQDGDIVNGNKLNVSKPVSSTPESKQKAEQPVSKASSSSSTAASAISSGRVEYKASSKGMDEVSKAAISFCKSNEQSDAVYHRKLVFRGVLQQILSYQFEITGLFITGSSTSGFGTLTSDMDLCLVLPNWKHESETPKASLPKLYQIKRAFLQALQLTEIQVIPAKCPIVTFTDYDSGLHCDLNVNNVMSIRNTHLMNAYSKVDPRVKQLVLLVKSWAKKQDINDAKNQTISSYSFALMVINYLQCAVSPPVAPCLQQLYPSMFNSNTDLSALCLEDNEKVSSFRSTNVMGIGDLMLGFLQYYSTSFSYKKDVVSVRTASVLKVSDCRSGTQGAEVQMWKHLNIEEPFSRTNTARSVHDQYQFGRIKKVFITSHQILSTTRDLSKLLHQRIPVGMSSNNRF